MRTTILVLLACLSAIPAVAQTKPVNPRTVIFNQDPADYPNVVRFEIAYFLPGATTPTSGVIDIGKPPQTTTTCEAPTTSPCILANVNTQPIPFGFDYIAKVRAVGLAGAAEVFSDWSDPSNPFDRKPGRPGSPLVK